MGENKTIISSLNKILESDPLLTKKVTPEEMTTTTFGVNDSELGEVYKAYEEWSETNQRETSDLANFLSKDPSLIRKVTYEEATTTTSRVDDSGLENAYRQYQKTKVNMGK